ncbi:MAG: glycosyl hydrolase [Pirellulaceae bacterium]|nr:MAG: glycosyl hydrolase [Pirellulaceae bacterium]
MKRWLCVLSVVAIIGVFWQHPAVAQDEGWIVMFNGQNLDGWKASENKESWSVEDGAIVCHGPRSHLFYQTEKPFKNFHFKCEVMTTPGSNSGIYFHTRYQETGWPKYGFECQVNISHADPRKSGSLYAVVDVSDPPAKDNEWYTQEIIVQGRNVKSIINGQVVVDYTEPEGKEPFSDDFARVLGEGTFALQAHDPQSKVYFRNLKVKRLP